MKMGSTEIKIDIQNITNRKILPLTTFIFITEQLNLKHNFG